MGSNPSSPIVSVCRVLQTGPPVLRANRKVAALRSARNTLFKYWGLRKTDQFSRTHRFLHRFFSRPSLRLQRVSLFPCVESNHPFQLLRENANLYVSNNGEPLLGSLWILRPNVLDCA